MRRNDPSVLQRCRDGERLAKTLTTNRAGNPVVSFCLEPSGTHVTESQALGLLRSGKFVSVGDGLLGLESSQTWRLKGAGVESNSHSQSSPRIRNPDDGQAV